MRIVSDKGCRVKKNAHFKFSVYEIMWKNIVHPGRSQMTIWRMSIACWIPKATNTHDEYAILNVFPQQTSLHERASILYVCCRLLLRGHVSVG